MESTDCVAVRLLTSACGCTRTDVFAHESHRYGAGLNRCRSREPKGIYSLRERREGGGRKREVNL